MNSTLAFNELERAVLNAICEAHEDLSQLRALLETAKVTSRDNTGHGFFTYFDTDFGIPPLQSPLRHVTGPDRWVKVDQTNAPMGFILWLANGRPDCIERASPS
jgi:hypothetical protein